MGEGCYLSYYYVSEKMGKEGMFDVALKGSVWVPQRCILADHHHQDRQWLHCFARGSLHQEKSLSGNKAGATRDQV